MTAPALTLPDFTLPASVAEARIMQEDLRHRLVLRDDFGPVELIAGIDVGYDLPRNLAHASIVVVSLDGLQPVEQVQCFTPAEFPYIPGLLAFREIPAILAALAGLRLRPDILMVDGHGIAHPKRMGIAAHLGVLLDRPSIGVAKSRLTGRFEMPGLEKGEQSPLMAGTERIGTVLRSRSQVNPLFISPGHRIGMESAVDLTLHCLTRYRLPEPTRLADKLSKCQQTQPSLFA